MPSEYRTQRRIEFSDTDQGGICHFARFFVFMESAEHEFWRSLGTPPFPTLGGDRLGWPRRAVRCEYFKPCKFEEVLDIHLSITRIGRKSLTYQFEFSREGEVIARGEVVAVCCVSNPGESLRSVPIPDLFVKQIEEHG